MIQSINPSTGDLIKTYDAYSSEEVGRKIDSAHLEYKNWKSVGFSERKDIFTNIANALENDLETHAQMISTEMGKPIKESRMEVSKCAWVIRFFADNTEEFLSDESVETDYNKSYIQYDPLGVILGIMPWNFPYWQVFRFIAPVIMGGNTCIVKHASNVSGCSLLIEKVIQENSPYKNIYGAIIVPAGYVKDIISHPVIKAVSLTGSDEAGSSVGMHAGKEIKKTVMELGGSDPFIVLSDADVKKAARVGVKARFFNNGQSCIAAKRFLVHEDIHDEFVENVKK